MPHRDPRDFQYDDFDGARLGQRVEALYEEMRRIAQRELDRAGSGRDPVLQPTALVNEVYLKLAHAGANWDRDSHFLAVAAKAARHVLLDHARAMGRQKRGGAARRLELDTRLLGGAVDRGAAIDLEEGLQQLERDDPRAARIVELRFFGGLSIEQCAERMDLSTSSVEREWRYARAWLYEWLFGDAAERGRPG